MTWQADYPTRDLVCSPLITVHIWYRLPYPDGFLYPKRTPVRLSIHHFRSLPVYHTVVSVHMVCCCRFVFYVCRAFSCLPSETSSCYGFNFFFCVHLVSCQMFFLFHRCNTYCRSYMGLGTHKWCCVCLPLYLLDSLIFQPTMVAETLM